MKLVCCREVITRIENIEVMPLLRKVLKHELCLNLVKRIEQVQWYMDLLNFKNIEVIPSLQKTARI